jgi:methyltransferase (TIGR00027 family)
MIQGISFFSPEIAEKLKGDNAAILKWITQTQLSSTPLARAAYAEKTVENEIKLGVEQYVILGAGLDTFAWRHSHVGVSIFEVDHPSTQKFKLQHIQQAGLECPKHLKLVAMDFTKELSLEKLISVGFAPHKKTIFSLLGVTYY